MDTFHLASLETECWRKANLLEEGEEEEQHLALSLVSTLHVILQRPSAKSMRHGSIIARLVAYGGSTKIKWESKDLDYKVTGKAYQPSMQRWKDSYGRCPVYESYSTP